MNKLERYNLVASLLKKLNLSGSWCGETHIQKATYLGQELCDVPLEYEFILYKHGPYSFGLRDEITAMQADNLLILKPRPHPYRPTYIPTELVDKLDVNFAYLHHKYDWHLSFIAKHCGEKGVSELERLATSYYVTKKWDVIRRSKIVQNTCTGSSCISL